jgi:hypothetical protein
VTRVGAFFRALGSPFRVLMDPEGRRAWALMLMAGGGLSMTIFAGFVLYIVKERPDYAFRLGVGALILIGIVITGYAGLLIKRTIEGGALGVHFRISDEQTAALAQAVVDATPPPPPPTVIVTPLAPASAPSSMEAADAVVDAATDKRDEIKGEMP